MDLTVSATWTDVDPDAVTRAVREWPRWFDTLAQSGQAPGAPSAVRVHLDARIGPPDADAPHPVELRTANLNVDAPTMDRLADFMAEYGLGRSEAARILLAAALARWQAGQDLAVWHDGVQRERARRLLNRAGHDRQHPRP